MGKRSESAGPEGSANERDPHPKMFPFHLTAVNQMYANNPDFFPLHLCLPLPTSFPPLTFSLSLFGCASNDT